MIKEFPKRLRALREASKQTQQQAADLLNVSRPAYTSYENGQREPGLEVVASIAKLYHVSGDYLLGLSDDMNAANADCREHLGLKDASIGKLAMLESQHKADDSHGQHCQKEAGKDGNCCAYCGGKLSGRAYYITACLRCRHWIINNTEAPQFCWKCGSRLPEAEHVHD